MDQDGITPDEALRQSRASLDKTVELAAEVDSKTQVVRAIRVENHWAKKIKDSWAGAGAA